MKIRTGFVSNSSTSSFVIVMTPKQEKEWKDQLNPYELQVITPGSDNYITRNEQKFDGRDVVVYGGSEGNFCFYEDLNLEVLDEDKDLGEDELTEKYECDDFRPWAFWNNAHGKIPNGVLETSIDS
jgi:hypothetical protein